MSILILFTNYIMSSKADQFTECHGISTLAIHDHEIIENCGKEMIQLTPNDVIFGRGRKSDNHKGNVHFRSLINTQLSAYIAACDGAAKRMVAEEIVKQVLEQKGRFLKWVGGAWSIADNQSTIQKVLKTLCNKMHTNRRLRQGQHYEESDVLSEETLQSNHVSNKLDMSTLSFQELTVASLGAFNWLLKTICKDSKRDNTLKIDILKLILSTFAFASSGNEACIQAVLDTDEYLHNLMIIIHEEQDTKIVMPALETVANIVTGNAHQVQEVLCAGFLDIAEHLLGSDTQDICKKACKFWPTFPQELKLKSMK